MIRIIEIYKEDMRKIQSLYWIKEYEAKNEYENDLVLKLDKEICNIDTLDFLDKDIVEILEFRRIYQRMGNYNHFMNELKRLSTILIENVVKEGKND